MENKYYTPDISEFYVGFEYEELTDENVWVKVNIGQICELDFVENDLEHNEGKKIRVKYLDKEDIESLGFKHLSEEQYYNDKKDLLLEVKNEYIRISGETNTPRFLFFHGKIKNKAELKKLLTQLNIGFN